MGRWSSCCLCWRHRRGGCTRFDAIIQPTRNIQEHCKKQSSRESKSTREVHKGKSQKKSQENHRTPNTEHQKTRTGRTRIVLQCFPPVSRQMIQTNQLIRLATNQISFKSTNQICLEPASAVKARAKSLSSWPAYLCVRRFIDNIESILSLVVCKLICTQNFVLQIAKLCC